MSVDIFSLWAIRNIGSALSVWQNELANGIKLAEDPSEVPKNRVLGKPLGFLGYVTQQHKEKSENKVSRVVEAYNTIKKQLPSAVTTGLKPWFPSPTFDPHLGDIRHLASLAPKSQTLHTPMITVTLKGSYTITRKQAREIYAAIAKRFVENLLSFAKVKTKHVT
jgi:hypothetical protein